jgi:hypothetical protein
MTTTSELALSKFARRLNPTPHPYLAKPAEWINDRLDEYLWSTQQRIAQSLVDNRQTAVQSCHGIGKSFLAARLICWWLEVHSQDETFVVSTAPTHDQVKGVLWNEIGSAHRKGELMGRVNMTEWLVGNQLLGFGRSPKNAHSFQGHHAKYLLVVLDEACGLPFDIWDAGSSLASNDTSRILAVGNPTDPTSHFRQVCGPGSGWNVIRVSAFETPNFTGEEVPEHVSEVLIGPLYVESQRNPVNGGEGSPMWSARILGEFPLETDNGVVRYSTVIKCQEKDRIWPEDELLPVELGVDVGAGGDMSVIMLRVGRVAHLVKAWKTPEQTDLIGAVVNAINFFGVTRVKVDETGVGVGVVSSLREKRAQGIHKAEIVGVMVGTRSRSPKRFTQLRDQLWWEIGRVLSESGYWDLSLLPDSTISQLVAPTFEYTSSGQIKVEKKDEMKKRIRRSPDEADALLLAFYAGVSRATRYLEELVAENGGNHAEPDEPPVRRSYLDHLVS